MMSVKSQSIEGGLLIVFEGIDGVGKTTQLNLVRDALKAEGWPVHTSRNLGGTPIGEELRKVMLSPLERPALTNLHISVAIQEALAGAIEAERQKGSIILLDRGPLSLAAYEIYGSKLDKSVNWGYVESGMSKLRPELTIIYNTDVQTAIKRSRQKPGKADYFESKPESYFKQVADGYKVAAERYCPASVITIDAGTSVRAVQKETMLAVRQVLKKAPKLN